MTCGLDRMVISALPWIGFHLFIIAMLWLDLRLSGERVMSIRRALVWTLVWVLLALVFCGGIAALQGPDSAMQFLSGYLLEKSLSVDNLFVFLLIFKEFQVPEPFKHRVLAWGIIGAVILRGALILAGTAIVSSFHWVLYLFGALLLWSAFKMATADDGEPALGENKLLKLAEQVLPYENQYFGDQFIVGIEKWPLGTYQYGHYFTKLFMVLLAIEFSDVIFALDSIPATLAVTQDPFLVYTSNIFAILGLRSLFFVVAGAMDRFAYLKYGVALVLFIIGLKILLGGIIHIPTSGSLLATAVILAVSVVVSIVKTGGKNGAQETA